MSNLVEANERRWKVCKINADKVAVFDSVAARLTAPEAKKRYQTLEKRTGVPWWFVAVVHEREASQRWDRSLAQGDPISRPSTHVPAGRPAGTWEDVAYDALVNCAPFAARNKDWSPGGALAMLEKYNGLGYANRNIPSPYVWAGTNQYISGKYIADHVFDPNAVDKQLGCAGLLIRMKIFSETSVPSVTAKNTANTSAGAVVAGGVVAGAAAAASSPHNWWPWIIAAALIIAGITWLAIRHHNIQETLKHPDSVDVHTSEVKEDARY